MDSANIIKENKEFQLNSNKNKIKKINKKISVVLACYNEAGNIPILYERLTNVLSKLTSKYEIIFVDDKSKDETPRILEEISKKDKHVIGIRFARGSGYSQPVLTAGMQYATGDCVVTMDGDGEDPPEVIPGFIEKWLDGYEVVYGVRRKRRISLFRRIAFRAFYRTMKKMSYVDMPNDAGDFALMDRRVVDAMNALPEKDRFLRCLRAFVGFKSTGLLYNRGSRIHGKTTNTFSDNLKWAYKAIFSISYAPLMFISYMAFITCLLAGIGILYYIIAFLMATNPPQGITTIIVLILLLGGMQLLAFSIIGGYIAKIFQEVKARPVYIIDRIIKGGKAKKV